MSWFSSASSEASMMPKPPPPETSRPTDRLVGRVRRPLSADVDVEIVGLDSRAPSP
jgi:hypothetical protein